MVVLQMDCSLLDKNILRKRQILGNTFIMNEPSSQLGTPCSPPLQLGPLFDRPGLGGVVVVEISGPSLSSMAVPSSVFVFWSALISVRCRWGCRCGDGQGGSGSGQGRLLTQGGMAISVELQG